MPIFEYRCSDCNSKFDIFHKSQKINNEEIICPKCGSKEHTKLLSSFKASVTNGISSSYDDSSCATGSCGVPSFSGGCADGSCGI